MERGVKGWELGGEGEGWELGGEGAPCVPDVIQLQGRRREPELASYQRYHSSFCS